MAFNRLVTNVDDHLQNRSFAHVAHGQRHLAPAFDINRFWPRIGNPGPGCRSRTDRSPTCGCCSSARRTSH
ncbi:HipA domain-containing protein [Methyloversatilis sp.]|uniref:HipA domain-containing protein n=1 Tax=Methyloversatilis sp. TaxID=2569862 RepID=UPI00359FC8C3